MSDSPAKLYYVSFRLRQLDRLNTYPDARYDEIVSLIEEASEGRISGRTSAHFTFRSEHGIEDIAEEIREYLSIDDVAVIGVYNSGEMKVLGRVSHEDELRIV